MLSTLLLVHTVTAAPIEWRASLLSFKGFEITTAAVNPSGSLLAVAYGDAINRYVGVYDANMSLVFSMRLSNSSTASLYFLNDSTLLVSEYVQAWPIPYSLVHLVNVASKRVSSSSRLAGTNLGSIGKALVVGNTLYVLTPRYLVGFSAQDISKRALIVAFKNRGLQALAVNETLVVLSIETNCYYCLMQNEKTLTTFSQHGSKNLTLCHVLLLTKLSDDSVGLVYDNQTLEKYTLIGANPVAAGRYTLLVAVNSASQPDYKVLYSLSINGLEIHLVMYSPANGTLARLTLPLPYTKGDEVGVKVYDSGRFIAWVGSTIVLGDFSGVEAKLETGLDLRDAEYRGYTVFAIGRDSVLVLKREHTRNNYTLFLQAVTEEGRPLDNFSLTVDGRHIGSFSSAANLTLPRGFHNITLEAPGYVPAVLAVNMTGDTRKVVVLERVKFPLIVRATTSSGDQPEILVSRESSRLARGVGYLEVNLPPGNYTVTVSYGNSSITKIVNLTGRLELFVTLNVTPPTAPPTNMTEPTRPRRENETLVVLYGAETCPDCRRTKEVLSELVGRVYFKDISNRSYLAEYNLLYDLAAAGEMRVVPLTLVFRGTRLQAVVAGPLPPEKWLEVLNSRVDNHTLVVTDSGEWVYRALNSTYFYEVATGGAAAAPREKGSSPTLMLILTLAAADSINPCTFMVFAALVTAVLSFAGKRKAAAAAAAFISAVFVCYTLLGLGLIQFIARFEWLKYVIFALTFTAGFYAIASTITQCGKNCMESAPGRGSAAGKLFAALQRFSRVLDSVAHAFLSKARGGSTVASFLAGAVVSFTLLPCSSGPYLVATYILSREEPLPGLLLLLAYNAVFVLPLVLIAVGVILGGRLLLAVDVVTVRLNAVRKWTNVVLGLLLIAISLYVLLLH